MIRSSRTISNAKPCSTFGNLPLIRSYTIATVVVCNTLCASGWRFSAGRRLIEIIDDDLGISAAGGATRAGFERMVAEVCLGKVGAVAAREVSRFARNSRDCRCAAWSTRYWLTRRPSTRRVWAMTGSCSG